MRRVALLALALALPGCSVSNPFENFGELIGDTHSLRLNPNRPVGHSENMLRAMGRPLNVDPLLPEPGNVWPGPQKPDPTLSDIERQQNLDSQPQQAAPGSPRRGSSTPPGNVPAGVTVPPAPPGPSNGLTPLNPTPNGGGTLLTPQGPITTNPGGNGITTYNGPGGRQGIVVPNGNGTSTLIAPDGSVSTVPNTR